MKKLLAFIMCVAMIATTCVIFASAAPVTDNFSPAGDYEITWDPEVADKIELDGDMQDWVDAGYTNYTITADNLISWFGTFDANFEITAFYVSDSEYLYIAFWIVDDDFVASVDSNQYSDGDAFQIGIDFNREMQKIIEEDPAMLEENPKNIFYSFDCVLDGDFVFYRQERLNDGNIVENLTDVMGDEGPKGRGNATQDGWCAEFILPWSMLYDDFEFKSYADDYVAVLDKNHDLQLGIILCYLDLNAPGNLSSAAGTFKDDATITADLFTPAYNGMSLTLKWEEGVVIDCEGILTPEEGEEYVTGIEEEEESSDIPEESSSALEETSATPEESSTEPEESRSAEETEAKTEAKTEAPKENSCKSVVATGAAVAVLAAAAAAVALKKKD